MKNTISNFKDKMILKNQSLKKELHLKNEENHQWKQQVSQLELKINQLNKELQQKNFIKEEKKINENKENINPKVIFLIMKNQITFYFKEYYILKEIFLCRNFVN